MTLVNILENEHPLTLLYSIHSPTKPGRCRTACAVATKLLVFLLLLLFLFVTVVVVCAKYDTPFVDKEFVRQLVHHALEPFEEVTVRYMLPYRY